MQKALLGLVQYIISLSALSVMVLTRSMIGPDVLLPFQMKISNAFTRTFLRFWMIVLLYVWIRIFFIIAVYNSSNPYPFDASKTIWDLLIEHDFPLKFGVDVFFYYLSYAASFAGLAQIVALEFHYKARNPISAGSLGVCLLTGRLKGKKILGNTIDQYLIWGLIEPASIVALSFILKFITGSNVLFAFFIFSGIAMFIQGQLARLRHRDLIQQIINAKQNAATIRTINDSFKEKQTDSKKSSEDENEASFA